MTGSVSAYNQVQKTLGNVNNIAAVTTVGSTPTVLYTCPAGKTATILAFSNQSVALGANTSMKARVKGINLRNMTGAEAGSTSENINGTLLQAGDTIVLVGDNAANNGTINTFLTIQELPA